MFRQRATEMLRRGLRSLDDLEAAEAAEARAAADSSPPPIVPKPIDALSDPALVVALVDFDPSDPYWADFGFDVDPGSLYLSSEGIGNGGRTPEAAMSS